MVAVEGSEVLVELGVRLRRFRQQHRRRVADVPATPDEELERVVEQRRVRALEVEPVPAGPHPRDVAVDGVDLAVVAEQAEGLRPLPGRRGVRGEALVEDAERDGERGIEQIRIERGELVGRAESLVRDGAERERRDIRAGRLLGSRARPVSAPLGLVQTRSEWTLQDELLDSRHRGARLVAERSRSHRNRAPAVEPDPFLEAGLLDRLAGRLVPDEDHGKPAPRGGEQRARNRQEQTGAVSGPAIGRDRAAVADSGESFQQPVDDQARRTAGRIGEEADSASVALAAQIVDGQVHADAPFAECEDSACCCDLAGVGGGTKRRLARKDARNERKDVRCAHCGACHRAAQTRGWCGRRARVGLDGSADPRVLRDDRCGARSAPARILAPRVRADEGAPAAVPPASSRSRAGRRRGSGRVRRVAGRRRVRGEARRRDAAPRRAGTRARGRPLRRGRG